ncbi:nuclear transport factor 2 family protein [Streptosporangium amethystogenes subsp. fukuiense]|uniref:Nuclear transport factor 2 family protein n=1 Tax=Streptosporangium amethystogenes subsp. fukuiense TaxID=698418 RepID=A0ABW2SVT9_9ACTN
MNDTHSTHGTGNAVTAVADAYFGAWQANQPSQLADVLAPDVRVNGPLGQIDGAAQYQASLARIFAITSELVFHKRWVDGDDVMTWFDLHPRGAGEPFPVASWLQIEGGRITRVRVTFDLGKLLQAGDPRRASTGQEEPGPAARP